MKPIMPLNILVLYYHSSSIETMRLGIKRHLNVFEYSEVEHDIIYFNVYDLLQDLLTGCEYKPSIVDNILKKDINVVILHTTLLCLRWAERLFPEVLERLKWLNEYEAIKIAFPQDEYDHSEILDQWLFTMNVDLVFSVLGQRHWKTLYPIMHDKAIFYECYTGYIDDSSTISSYDSLPYENRQFDIVYRASHLPFWFGSLGQLKHELANVFVNNSKKYRLNVDISTKVQDVILGKDWLHFLRNGRTVVGCESGSSVLDYRGEVQALIKAFLLDDPKLSFNQLKEKMPLGWDSYTFTAISPRHFEAVETKTCQILVEGNYSGVLLPNIHYISLKRDFSNLDLILEKIKDHQYCQSIAERAYEDIFLSRKYSYKAFSGLIEQAILSYCEKSSKVGSNMNIENAKFTILERQLVSERHRNDLLQAKLMEASKTIESSKMNIAYKNLDVSSKKKLLKLLSFLLKNKKILFLMIAGAIAFLGLNSFLTAFFILRYLSLN